MKGVQKLVSYEEFEKNACHPNATVDGSEIPRPTTGWMYKTL